MKKKYVLLYISISLILITSAITVCFIHQSKTKDVVTATINNADYKKNEIIENEIIENAKKTLSQGNLEETLIEINGEKISKVDFNEQKFINENVNKTLNKNVLPTSDEEIINTLIKNEILLQEAKKENITIDDDERNTVIQICTQSIGDKDEEIAKEMGITKQEYLDFTISHEINSRIISNMHDQIVIKISNNQINIDNKEFNEKLSEFNNETDDMQRRSELLKEIYDIYIKYLLNNSNIIKY